MERLAVTTPPTSEPVTLEQVKNHLRVDFADDDLLIGGLISAVRSWCETRVRQAFLTQTVTMYLDEFPAGGGYYNRQIRRIGPTSPFWLPSSTFPITLFMPPVQTVLSVTYYNMIGELVTIDPATYLFDEGVPARIAPVYGTAWPTSTQPRIGAIQIQYVVGYGDAAAAIPASVLQPLTAAILLGVAGLYYNRGDAPGGMPVDTMTQLLGTIDHGGYS